MRSILTKGLFLFLLFLLFNQHQLLAQSNVREKEQIDRLEKLIPRLMNEGDVPGLSIALIRNGKIFWHKGFGVKNAETKEPIDNNTVFEAASLSKPVLAYAAMKLVDEGKLDLDKPLSGYLPKPYLENDERINLITARMVLSHKTGFQNEVLPGNTLKIYFTPGEKFSYSGEGYLYLQKVIEQITGEPFDVFMKKTVFEPLGMTSSSYVWQNNYETLKTYGHKSSGVVAERRKPTIPRTSGLHMTVVDYAKFVIAVMNGAGLKKETTKQILKTQVQLDESCFSCIERATGQLSKTLSWGLGWAIEQTENGNAFWHWGENNGEFQNFVMAYPKNKTGVVIFTNSGNGISIMPEIVSQAIGGNHPAFAWMGYEPYNSPIKILFKDILKRGATAINDYRKTRSGAGGLNEAQINDLGYWLMGRKLLKEAIEIFKLNVENYPKSANAYDSLGEAYMNNGDKELAIKNYQKSLELNPNNTNAIEVLKRLNIK